MKPVNFIKPEGQVKLRNGFKINRIIIFTLPLVIVFGLITLDYFHLKKDVSSVKDEILISEEEMMILKSQTETLEEMLSDLKNSQYLLSNLEEKTQKAEKIINLLNISSELESNNIFFTSIALDETLTLMGNSLEKESVNHWLDTINGAENDFYIGELSFSNGFYTFIITERGENDD